MNATNEKLTVGDLAKMFNVSLNTIRNYTDRFSKVFSDIATREHEFKNAKQRYYTPYDVLVMNTIVSQQSKYNDDERLIETIEAGDLDDQLPETSALVMPTGAGMFSNIVTLRRDLKNALGENERLRSELGQARQALIAKAENVGDNEREYLKQIGRMEYEIEMLQKRIAKLEDNADDE